AEDGIRDRNVTGVQTCALPICFSILARYAFSLITGDRELEMLGRYEENAYLARMLKLTEHPYVKLFELQGYGHDMTYPGFPILRSEERRVGKECRSRWVQYGWR